MSFKIEKSQKDYDRVNIIFGFVILILTILL